MFREYWHKLISLGIHSGTDPSEKREIRILNAMSVFAALFNIIFSFWWLVLGIFEYSAINYIMSITLIGVLLLNKTGNYKLAKGFFFITVLIHIASISIIFKFQSEFYLFPLIIIAGFIFQKKKLLFMFGVVTFIVYLLMTGEFIVAENVDFERKYSPLINFLDGIIAMAFTVLALNQFLNQVELNRREIIVKNKLLEEAVNVAKERADYSNLLLKEMNHRIKNNLQMVSSLLSIHAERAPSKLARKALLEAKSRIYSIALIHKQLYINENISKIDMAQYIDELIPFIKESLPQAEEMVRIDCQCDHVSLYIEEAVTLGLIINELLTNAVKHGASEGKKIIVKIIITYENEKNLYLGVESNGKKINEYELLNSKNFGMDLVEALASTFDGQIKVNEKLNRIEMKLNIGNSYIINGKNGG